MLYFISAFFRSFKPKQSIFSVATNSCRVTLGDIDLNLHLTNSKYLKYMDRGRVEQMVVSGLFIAMLKRRLTTVVANTEISYIRSLQPLQAFEVHTQLMGYDQKYFYYEQVFVSNGSVYTSSMVRTVWLKQGKPIPTKQALALMGFDTNSSLIKSPELPPRAKKWGELLRLKKTQGLSNMCSTK